jgi:hypothetical protein
MVRLFLRTLVAVVTIISMTADGVPAEPSPGLATARWKLESITLHDGRCLEGLIVEPAAAGGPHDPLAPIGFVQIVQPPGRAMELITWAPINATRIAAIERLPDADHALLTQRVDTFRNHRGRQHAAETAVTLLRDDEDEPWRYAGRWFTIDSTADPSLTRKAVVLLEQVFTALEALVPPAVPAGEEVAPLQVKLCGTASEYRAVQESLGIEAEHPAFYLPARGLLVAGSDMPAMIEQERNAADSLAITEREISDRDRTFETEVRRLAGDLEKQGMPAGKRAEIVQLARNRWQRERDEMLAQVVTARRDNAARVAEARRGFAARLTHEAWHAYANRRLGGSERRPLPLWLDEGLAQVFETAALEAGELRLDAPDPIRLKALQELLAGRDAPPLVDLLRAGQGQFLVGHAGGRKASQQSYLMAWGLAFHLAVLEPVLAPTSLAAICEPPVEGDASTRVVEFERLVGMPIADFDTAWRRRMLALRPR